MRLSFNQILANADFERLPPPRGYRSSSGVTVSFSASLRVLTATDGICFPAVVIRKVFGSGLPPPCRVDESGSFFTAQPLNNAAAPTIMSANHIRFISFTVLSTIANYVATKIMPYLYVCRLVPYLSQALTPCNPFRQRERSAPGSPGVHQAAFLWVVSGVCGRRSGQVCRRLAWSKSRCWAKARRRNSCSPYCTR